MNCSVLNCCIFSSEGRHSHVLKDVIQKGVKKKSRKRKRDPKTWKSNIRKKAHDEGKEYISVRKKIVPAKHVTNKKDCLYHCSYECQKFITEEERGKIFQQYYTLNETEKKIFLISTTKKFSVQRHRKGKNKVNSRRKYTFCYFFNVCGQDIQVCKIFYLGTLNISQTPIYNAHLGKDFESNTPKKNQQGKHVKHKILDEDRNLVKMHIENFPKVESHYCRANTSREYLDSNLSIAKMYLLYVEFCTSKNKQPVKESYYRFIFCNEYNLFFHTPKKDRCDLCEEVELLKKENRLTDKKNEEYLMHTTEKNACRNEKKK